MSRPDQDQNKDADIQVETLLETKRPSTIPIPPAFAKITTGAYSQLTNYPEDNSNKKVAKYSGLSNQGSTCYLNSLVQSLFMTPEFRLNLLNWKFDETLHGSKIDCIPLQLQKLFARLQLKLRYAEETKGLTKSFQWDSGEVFMQHDIQELCRKLFEAIELSLGPEDYNFINDLYEGTSSSIVKCQECGYMSENHDKFLDLVLPVRNDFEKIYNKSLTMAICNFLKPEVLSESNQYMCSGCNKKVDALKYMKFTKLPKILFVSMSRFEYDYMTDSRKKINDKVPFPLLLNFNNYMKDYSEIKYDATVEENEDECLFLKEEEKNTNTNTDNELGANSDDNKIEEKTDKVKIHNETLFQEKIKEYIEQGPNVYELYSIVIHSGTANGGHYYAYIKSFEDNQWYSFNDSTVSPISVVDIKKVFGGVRETDSRYASSTTGYVLMYRIINPANPTLTSIDDAFINQDLKKDIDEETEKILEEDRKWKEKLANMTLRIYFDNVQKQIIFKKTELVKDLKLAMMKEFDILDKFNPEDVRIRCYNQYANKPLEFYHEEDTTLEANSIISYKSYTLDFRNKETGKFEEYDPDLINLQLYLWKDENFDKSENEFEYDVIRISNKTTLENLKKRICELYGFDTICTPLYIFRKLEISSNNFSCVELFKMGDDLSRELFKCAILDNTKIYIEVKDTLINYSSKFYSILSEKLSNVIVKFNFPINPEKIPPSKITVHDYKIENEIEMKRTATMKLVKDKIGEYLALKQEEFIMKKYNHNGGEIRNLTDTIMETTTGSVTTFHIYIEFGNPMGEDELKINVILCELDMSVFKLFPYKLTEIDAKLIKTGWTIKELKNMLINEIKEKTSLELDPEYVLIRESVTDRPGRIYNENSVINTLEFAENKKILVQEYKKEKLEFDSEQVQVTIRFWDVEKWVLSDPIEIHVTKKSKLLTLADTINRYFPEIHPENIELYRIVNGFNLYMDGINNYQFVKIYERCDSFVENYPFFLTTHGNLLLIKDSSQVLREPTEEERKFYCKPEMSDCTALVIVPQTVNNNENQPKGKISEMVNLLEKGGANFANRRTGGVRYVEKGIKITVKKNQVAEEEHKENGEVDKDKENDSTNNKDTNKANNESKKESDNVNYADYQFEEAEEFGPLI